MEKAAARNNGKLPGTVYIYLICFFELDHHRQTHRILLYEVSVFPCFYSQMSLCLICFLLERKCNLYPLNIYFIFFYLKMFDKVGTILSWKLSRILNVCFLYSRSRTWWRVPSSRHEVWTRGSASGVHGRDWITTGQQQGELLHTELKLQASQSRTVTLETSPIMILIQLGL